MHAWEAIQATLDYIETNIGEELTIEQLANKAALSPFYYQRLFSRLVQKPVREYIKLRRLARACGSLAQSKSRILDIALSFGFGSHETFTRSFKEAYGMTPEAFRKRPVQLNQFDKPDLLLRYAMVREGAPLISDGLVLEFNRKALVRPLYFLGLSGRVSVGEQLPLGKATGVDVPGEIWRKFHEAKHGLPLLEGGRGIGISLATDPVKMQFTYFAGEEAAPGTEAPGFEAYTLAAGEYLVCGFEAEDFQNLVNAALNKAMNYCGFWIERQKVRVKGEFSEIYYDSSPQGAYMEIWMPLSVN